MPKTLINTLALSAAIGAAFFAGLLAQHTPAKAAKAEWEDATKHFPLRKPERRPWRSKHVLFQSSKLSRRVPRR